MAGRASAAQRFPDPESVARAAATLVLDVGARATAARPIAIAFSGGRTPQRMFEILASSTAHWEHVHLFWVDERAVSATDPASNYGGAVARWLRTGGPPTSNVHRIMGELPANEAAARYDHDLRAWFAARGDYVPAFDLVLLGMGADGHTASLFPGDASLDCYDRWVVESRAPVAPLDRVTLTLPAISAALRVVFVVTGADKRDAILRIRLGDRSLPAARVPGADWILDEAADAGGGD